MNTLKKIAKNNIIWGVVAAAVLLVAWHIAYLCIKNDYILPGIGQTLQSFFGLFSESSFYSALGNTVARTAISFVISFVLAAAFASLAALFRPLKTIFACIISVVRTLPTMAITLMLLIWSSPRIAPTIVTGLVLFPMLYAQCIAAIDGVDANLLEMAKVYRVSRREKLSKIIAPAVAPEVISQVGAGLSMGLKVMVSAEVLSYTLSSMGGLMQQARLYAEMPRFAALTLVCIIVGLLLELLSFFIRRLVGKWRIKEGSNAD